MLFLFSENEDGEGEENGDVAVVADQLEDITVNNHKEAGDVLLCVCVCVCEMSVVSAGVLSTDELFYCCCTVLAFFLFLYSVQGSGIY